jgi:hypothetical protein
MTYELIFMRKRNSQIIDIFRTDDIKKFRKIRKHIITTHGLTRIRRGRANIERYSHEPYCDYVMVSKEVENNPIKEVLQIANKCFTQEVV